MQIWLKYGIQNKLATNIFFPASELRYLSFWYGILIPMALFLGFTLFRLVVIIADTH